MTFLEDFNSTSDISSDFSNISKYADDSFNALLTSYSMKSFSQTAINDTAAVTTEVNIITVQSEIDNVS